LIETGSAFTDYYDFRLSKKHLLRWSERNEEN